MFFEAGSPTASVYAYCVGESSCFNVFVINWWLPDTYISSTAEETQIFKSRIFLNWKST